MNALKLSTTKKFPIYGTRTRYYLRDVVIDVFRRVREESFESVPSPLQRVLYGVGKVLERANWNLLLGRILRGAVALGQVRNDNLREEWGGERERRRRVEVSYSR